MGNFLMGLVLFLTGILLTMSLSSFILRKLLWGGGSSGAKINTDTRRYVSRLETSFGLLLTLVVCVWSSLHAHNVHIEYVNIPVKGLSPRLNGTTIVQLSDIHLGPFIGRSRLEAIVQRTNRLDADIVAITGDLVDSSVANLWEAIKPLEKLTSKYGVYYSTGNHEYYTGDVDRWIEELPRLNVRPLINDRVCLLAKDQNSCHDGLYIAGLEDIDTRRIRYGHHSMNIHRALSGRTEDTPTIVLAHQTKAAAEAIYWPDVRLVLSGHTHAGQLFPVMILVYMYNPFFVGLYEPLVGVYVYVSAGTHYYLLPFRHYRPEITHLTLISTL